MDEAASVTVQSPKLQLVSVLFCRPQCETGKRVTWGTVDVSKLNRTWWFCDFCTKSQVALRSLLQGLTGIRAILAQVPVLARDLRHVCTG